MTTTEMTERIAMLEIQNLRLKNDVAKRDAVLYAIETEVTKFDEKGFLKKLVSIAELIYFILTKILALK
jgi:hypothetical protein